MFRPTSLDQLRLLPDQDRVALLKARREDQWFDRTSARVQPRALADAMMAFANAEGGLIVVGIHNGVIEGVSGAETRMNEWRQSARILRSHRYQRASSWSHAPITLASRISSS